MTYYNKCAIFTNGDTDGTQTDALFSNKQTILAGHGASCRFSFSSVMVCPWSISMASNALWVASSRDGSQGDLHQASCSLSADHLQLHLKIGMFMFIVHENHSNHPYLWNPAVFDSWMLDLSTVHRSTRWATEVLPGRQATLPFTRNELIDKLI